MKAPKGSEVIYEWVSRTQEVMAFRDQGRVVTCSAICPHMGARLVVERSRRGTRVTCPWHGLAFSMPDGRCDHPRYRRLRMIASDVDGDRIAFRERAEGAAPGPDLQDQDAHDQDDST